MQPTLQEMILQLCAAEGISGFEARAAAVAEELLRPYCDRTEIDRTGSVLGWRSCGKPGAKTVLLDAHIDQIGFLVTQVLSGGFLRFTQVGGVDPRMLAASDVTILTDPPRPGIIASTPPHLTDAADKTNALALHEMLIDTGLTDASCIPVGTPVVFAEPPYELAPGQLAGKCLDDRAGFALLVETMKQLQNEDLNVDIVILGSVHEEIDSLGAITGAFRIQPDCGIAVDVTHAKTPDGPSEECFAFGGGPTIGMGPNLHRGLTRQLMETARAQEIPYQIEVMEGSAGTNAWDMQVVRSGIAMALLSIPEKYMHTPIETICMEDAEQTCELLVQFLRRFDGEVNAK